MKCRECPDRNDEPYIDEFNGAEKWAFECKACGRWIGSGFDEDDALPKTCPRWCPKRKERKEKKDGKADS